MNIFLMGKDSAMLFLEKEDLESHTTDDLHSLAASVLPEDFSGEDAELTSFSLSGGLVLHLKRQKKIPLVINITRPGLLYDRLLEAQDLLEGQYCEIFKLGRSYYLTIEDGRLARILKTGFNRPSASLRFILEHGIRVSSFLLNPETVGKGTHGCLKGIDRKAL